MLPFWPVYIPFACVVLAFCARPFYLHGKRERKPPQWPFVPPGVYRTRLESVQVHQGSGNVTYTLTLLSEEGTTEADLVTGEWE